MGGCIQNTVQNDQARLFIQFIFFLASLGDFNGCYKI